MREILERLEQTLKQVKSSALLTFNAGLTRETIEYSLRGLPFTVPDDIFALYEWRNGSHSNYDTKVSNRFLTRFGYLIPLERSIDQWRHLKDFDYFSRSYLPLIEGGGEEFLIFNCDESSEDFQMVLSYEIKHVFLYEGAVPIYDSISSMLQTIIECFEKRAYYYVNNDPILEVDFELEMTIINARNPKACLLRTKRNIEFL